MKMDLVSASYDPNSDEKQTIVIKNEFNQLGVEEEPFYLLKETPGLLIYAFKAKLYRRISVNPRGLM
jgi:hypothetical protein